MTTGIASENHLLLVVDDSEASRFLVSTWLRRAGFEVIEAASGQEGLDLVASREVDLVVLDVNLPDIAGTEVCWTIKHTPATMAIPVLHVSATATATADRTAGLAHGADGYLVEPVDPEELLATVGALLRYSMARRDAERLAAALSRLHESSLALNTATDLEQLLEEAAAGLRDLLDADAAAFAVGHDGLGIVSSAHCDGPTTTASDPALNAADEQGALDRLAVLVPASASLLPVTTLRSRAGRSLGFLAARRIPEASGHEDLVVRQLGQSAAVAIENLRALDAEHDVAMTLQQSLLPAPVPMPPWLEVGVRYTASAQHAEVGGDFYELLVLGETVIVAIGDVQGHSLEAATIMGELRHAMRAYLLEGHGPAATLNLLNRLLCRDHPETIATVACASIDRRDATLTLANAGHIPPLVAGPGRNELLAHAGPLLGAQSELTECSYALLPGDVLVMVTDGLVERRGLSLQAGLDRLAETVGDGSEDVELLCDRLLRDVPGGARLTDDVAIVVAAFGG